MFFYELFNTLFALIHHAANMIGCVVRKLYLFLKEGITFRYGNRKSYFEGSLFLDAHIACYWWRIYHLWRDLRGRKLLPQMSVSEATHMDCLSNMSQLNHHILTCYNKKIDWKKSNKHIVLQKYINWKILRLNNMVAIRVLTVFAVIYLYFYQPLILTVKYLVFFLLIPNV